MDRVAQNDLLTRLREIDPHDASTYAKNVIKDAEREIERLMKIEDAARDLHIAVAKTGDHVQWFPAIAAINSALNA